MVKKLTIGTYHIFIGLWFEFSFIKKRGNALDLILDWQLNLGWLHVTKFKRKLQKLEGGDIYGKNTKYKADN